MTSDNPDHPRMNLIVTCGTSQIDAGNLRDLRLQNCKETIAGLLLDEPKVRQTPGPNYRAGTWDAEDNALAQCFSRINTNVRASIEHNRERLGQLVGNPRNPLGAELSTLVKLNSRPQNWIPEVDRIVILASETRAGLFCAHILKQVLADCWNTQAEIQVVPGLSAYTNDEEAAARNLTVYVTDNLIDENHNVLVATGGYKSIIPALTMISYFTGAEMVYLFEATDHLQTLEPWRQVHPDQLPTIRHQLVRLQEQFGDFQHRYLSALIEFTKRNWTARYNYTDFARPT